jgi:hypothetical protein
MSQRQLAHDKRMGHDQIPVKQIGKPRIGAVEVIDPN